jgi:NADH:ubiquinone oxidoreductase subunit F (NADH-binding)
MLGSAAFMVVGEGTCMVEVALRLARFFRHESCGKCIPCRDGTYQIVRILEGIKAGKAAPGAIDDLNDLAAVMRQAAFCGLGQAAVNPVMSCIRHFRAEFEAHAAGVPCSQLGGGENPYGSHH